MLCVDLELDNREWLENVLLSMKKEIVTREKKVILSYCDLMVKTTEQC